MEKDPVCGRAITTDNVLGTVFYQGRRYYFCSMECQQCFEGDPLAFVLRRLEREDRAKDRSEDG
jgi:YHS domain-containing protein